jgi:hypothetical protein
MPMNLYGHRTGISAGEILRKLLGMALAVGLMLAGAARAHHGFDGRYDLASPIWVEGTVVEAYFGHPHSELIILVPDDVSLPSPQPDLGPAGTFLDAEALVIPEGIVGRTVVLELPPTRQYSVLGDRISEGDMVAAVAVRNCEPPHQLNVQWLRLPDGEVESRTASMSYMVEGC